MCMCKIEQQKKKKKQRYRHTDASKARAHHNIQSHKLDPGEAYNHKGEKDKNIITGVKLKSQKTEQSFSNVKLSSGAFIDSSFL